MNPSHSWKFSIKTIRQRLRERNYFLDDLCSENKAFRDLRTREILKSNRLIGNLDKQEELSVILENTNSTISSDKLRIEFIWNDLFIRNYLSAFDPPINFKELDDESKHIEGCDTCLKTLLDVAERYQTITPDLGNQVVLDFLRQYKVIQLGLFEEFMGILTKAVEDETQDNTFPNAGESPQDSLIDEFLQTAFSSDDE